MKAIGNMASFLFLVLILGCWPAVESMTFKEAHEEEYVKGLITLDEKHQVSTYYAGNQECACRAKEEAKACPCTDHQVNGHAEVFRMSIANIFSLQYSVYPSDHLWELETQKKSLYLSLVSVGYDDVDYMSMGLCFHNVAKEEPFDLPRREFRYAQLSVLHPSGGKNMDRLLELQLKDSKQRPSGGKKQCYEARPLFPTKLLIDEYLPEGCSYCPIYFQITLLPFLPKCRLYASKDGVFQWVVRDIRQQMMDIASGVALGIDGPDFYVGGSEAGYRLRPQLKTSYDQKGLYFALQFLNTPWDEKLSLGRYFQVRVAPAPQPIGSSCNIKYLEKDMIMEYRTSPKTTSEDFPGIGEYVLTETHLSNPCWVNANGDLALAVVVWSETPILSLK